MAVRSMLRSAQRFAGAEEPRATSQGTDFPRLVSVLANRAGVPRSHHRTPGTRATASAPGQHCSTAREKFARGAKL